MVTLDVNEPVEALVCNAAELRIQTARLETAAGTTIDGRVELDEAAQRATFAFESTLAARAWLPAARAIHRDPQRPAARLLPQHVH